MLLRIGNSAAKRFFSTIYAHSSGQGKSGVAVIRVSGPKSIDVLKRLTGLKKVPLPRTAILRKFSNPTTGCTIDKGLVLFFPAPKSFTGDDVVEFHIHGGKAVVAAMLSAIGQVQNCFPAEPGDFTRRAFLAGKMDLTEVEGLADLLSAETEAQRQQALLQMEGHLGQLYKKWAEQLARCMAHVEAFIDFSEDDNIEDGVLEAVDKQVKNLMKEIQGHLSDGRRGEILRSGVSVSIVGEPNVGKSSILNTLAQRPAAIVTSQAGTTRDVVQVSLDLGGYPVQLSDTAGLREANDEVEKEGIRRARVSAEKADLVLLVASAPEIYRDSLQNMGFDDSIKKYLRKCDLEINPKNCIIILNKNDLLENDPSDFTTDLNVVHTSCESREGMNQLLKVLQEKLSLLCGEPSKECPTITQARHRAHIENCSNYLQKFLLCMEENHDLVIAAEQLRQALRNLGLLTGKVSTEQLLDLVFSEFCIGK
ncbi:tRNA modification GTPase GTPBP3, mitochondrial [Neocloeon triangulifer]|uniref:tRNA modification GTPase GTPBP3, mitochondrial n=1 Tax=Neocloeon triangulifer TaxID=2078957 RepID=UPI00286F0432|nr:tRNA modification GTPase GTPBP3, mitochondrial [Neocloeon triangulifer]